MKMRFTAILTFALSLIFSSIALGQTYTLVCKPGSTLGVSYRYGKVKVAFKKGTKAAIDGVESGTCAWLDRGVRQNEPSAACQSLSQNDFMWSFNSGSKRLTSMTSRTNKAPYVADAYHGRTFYLKITGRNGNCFNITGFGL